MSKSGTKSTENESKSCKFQKEWLENYSWIEEVEGNPQKAKCIWCLSTISIGSRGVSDLTKHMETAKHKAKASDKAGSKPITHFLKGIQILIIVKHYYISIDF